MRNCKRMPYAQIIRWRIRVSYALLVLMLAYMNRESFRKSLETGYTWFYSRSRQTLWNKGATSGHTQKVISMYADCDDDTLLVKVVQTGAACHTGSHSCFYKEIARN